jgi:hypothetical protein
LERPGKSHGDVSLMEKGGTLPGEPPERGIVPADFVFH